MSYKTSNWEKDADSLIFFLNGQDFWMSTSQKKMFERANVKIYTASLVTKEIKIAML